jgi:hypothetical protein
VADHRAGTGLSGRAKFLIMKSSANLKVSPRYLLKNLKPEQVELLEKWLFEDCLSYGQVVPLVEKELNIKVGVKSLFNFYRKQSRQRTVNRIIHSAQNTNEVLKAFAENPADTYKAILNIAGQIAFDKALKNPDEPDVATIRDFTKLLISAKQEKLMAQKFSLDREKWEFDIAQACAAHHAQLEAIATDKTLNDDARIQAIREKLFGDQLPKSN